MKLVEKIARASVTRLIRFSCVLSLVGLAILMISIFVPAPLPVIFAMSIGHVVGVQRGAVGGAPAGDGMGVLEGVGQAVERAGLLATGGGLVGGPGVAAGAVLV